MHATEKVYRAFHESKERKLYFSQLKELTKLSHSSLQNALEKLEQDGEIQKEATTGNVFYALSKTRITALRFAELDVKRFEALHRSVRVPLIEFLKHAPQHTFAILLFGSAARKQETAASDIDLLVIMHQHRDPQVQESTAREIIAACEEAKRYADAVAIHSISLAFTTLDEFRQGSDHLIAQAKVTGFTISNQQQYYEAM